MAEDPRAEELAEAIRAIQERVRTRYPNGAPAGIPLADLMPIVHARDAAESKVAAIGSVNPRRGGPVNALVQGVKRLVARALDWHVREQIEFNRAMLNTVEAILGSLNELNRSLVRVGKLYEELPVPALLQEAAELKDIRSHWIEWRKEWELKLATNEVQFLRAVSDLQAAYQQRTALMESTFREQVGSQHRDFTGALERSSLELQQKLWADLDRIKTEYERVIHAELRLMRQRSSPSSAAPSASPTPLPAQSLQIDELKFADKFRGPREHVKESQRFYVGYFQGRKEVVDLGCGRGEFLELMREAGVSARGIDSSDACIAICRGHGLEAERGDMFEYLAGLADASLDGVFSSQVIEHLPPARVTELIALAARKLSRDGLIALETPNPECLAIFATHFYLDPTHTHPIPPALLAFYLEEAGFGRIEVHRRSPAIESIASVRALPGDFREAFFGGLDYAVLARRL